MRAFIVILTALLAAACMPGESRPVTSATKQADQKNEADDFIARQRNQAQPTGVTARYE